MFSKIISMETPIVEFTKIKHTLHQIGIAVGKAKNTYTPILPEEVSLREIEDGSLDIGLDGIFLTDDLGVRRQVFLYKRACYLNLGRSVLPKMHLCRCGAIARFVNKEGDDAYRKANTAKVKVISRNTGREIWLDNIFICQRCAHIMRYDVNMDSQTFMEQLKMTLPVEEEYAQQSYEVDIYGYTRDWREISRHFREQHKYTCEKCGVQVSALDSGFMHVHHRNGDKLNNRASNLQCLCIKCHSEIDDTHRCNFNSPSKQRSIEEFMQNYADKRFINK